MKLGPTRSLYNYWNSLRGNGDAPFRCEIDPAAMRGYLPEVFLLSRANPKRYPFRIAGTRLCSFFGRELRDADFLDMWSTDEREGLESLLLTVTDDCAGAVVGISAETADGRSVDLEALFLPLRLDSAHCSQVIGTISPFRNEFWLGHHPIARQSIQSLRLLWPSAGSPPLPTSRPRMEPLAVVPSAAPRKPVRAQLVVIEGGRS